MAYTYKGQSYNSFEELPPEAQAFYADKNINVIPQELRDEASEQEVSSNFPYRAIIGVIFILCALLSIGFLIFILI
jgi:hypothetical protein